MLRTSSCPAAWILSAQHTRRARKSALQELFRVGYFRRLHRAQLWHLRHCRTVSKMLLAEGLVVGNTRPAEQRGNGVRQWRVHLSTICAASNHAIHSKL